MINHAGADLIRGSLAMAGRVVRYACWPTLTNQTIGEHCWHIARIYTKIFGRPTSRMAAFIQNHDSPELLIGDPPFPVKRDNPDLKAACDRIEAEAIAFLGVDIPELTPIEKVQFKVCDLLEMTEYGMYERQLGNLLAVPIIHRTESSAWQVASKGGLPMKDAEAMAEYICDIWAHHERVLAMGAVPKNGYLTRAASERVSTMVSDWDNPDFEVIEAA